MHLRDVDAETLMLTYHNPKLQGAVVEWVTCVRGYDRSQRDHWLESAVQIATETVAKLPFDTVMLEGEDTDSPSEVMAVVAHELRDAGLISGYDPPEATV